jgi:hypothetical protein
VGNEGVRVLAVGCLKKLRVLNLYQNSISDSGYKWLAECEVMLQLSELMIYEGNPASLESKNLLRRSKRLCSLRHIR